MIRDGLLHRSALRFLRRFAGDGNEERDRDRFVALEIDGVDFYFRSWILPGTAKDLESRVIGANSWCAFRATARPPERRDPRLEGLVCVYSQGVASGLV